MSLTPQRVRQSNVTPTSNIPKSLIQSGNWSKVLPTKFDTEARSCVFVKKLITVAISNITYLRSMFPENAYANRSLDGLKLKILKSNSDCPEALNLASWLTGALDAIEKKYLRELLLVVYDDPSNPDIVRELYTFKFSYPEGRTTCQMEGGDGKQKQALNIASDDIYKSTQNLLRNIVVLTQGLDHLSDSLVTMKLTYYDAVTPADYEPAGFVPTPLVELVLPPGSTKLGSGQVDTGFHSMQLQVMAAVNQNVQEEEVVHEAVPSQEAIQEIAENKNSAAHSNISISGQVLPVNNEQNNSERETIEVGKCKSTTSTSKSNVSSAKTPVVTLSVKKTPVTAAHRSAVGRSPVQQTSDVPSVNSSVSLASGQSESSNILCICLNTTVDSVMLQCSVCNNMQHAPCYRIVSQDQAPQSHVCVKCSIETGQTCTDPKLVKMKDNPGITSTCLFRRALVLLTEVDAVSQQDLMTSLGVEAYLASALLKRLGNECLEEDHGQWVVKKEQLRSNLLPKYMGRKKVIPSGNNTEVDGVKAGKSIYEERGSKKRNKCSVVGGPSLPAVTGDKGRSLVPEGEVNSDRRLMRKRKVSGVMESLNI